MRIGIVTPAFNVAPYIADTIRSVLAQSHTDWRMVVVDDGSTDGTGGVVSGFADPRLRLIVQPNAGVSAARNRGAAALEDYDAMLFLDGDDTLAPFALAVLTEALDRSVIAAVGAYVRGGQIFPPASGDLLARLLVCNLFVNGGHVLIPREAVRPFRTNLRYGEDWEFWVRLASAPQPPSSPTMTGVFRAVSDPRPLLFVRERPSGAYLRMATDPASFTPCLDAIHGNPALAARFTPRERAALRRRAEAEVQWTIGRELMRHGRYRDGLAWLRRSFAAAPTARRSVLLAAAHGLPLLPPFWRGPLRPYAASGTVQAS